jgi:hypothetical protein
MVPGQTDPEDGSVQEKEYSEKRKNPGQYDNDSSVQEPIPFREESRILLPIIVHHGANPRMFSASLQTAGTYPGFDPIRMVKRFK